MPRPKQTPDQLIKKLRAENTKLKDKISHESWLATQAQQEAFALQERLDKKTQPSAREARGGLTDPVGVELTVLYDVLRILEGAPADQRYRILSMIDARYYDPPLKAAK